MKFENNKNELRLNKLLTQWVPVLEDRAKPAIRARLWLNYFLEVVMFLAVAISRYSKFSLQVNYLLLACLSARICLSLVSLRLGRLNIQLLSKLVTILSVFCMQDSNGTLLGAIALVVQISASWVFAFSGEQRRGKFDERLNLWIPFTKEMLAYKCVFLGMNYDDETACYILLLLSAFHLIFSCLDELYDFTLKKALAGLSLFNLVTCGSLVLLVQFPDLEPSSLVVVSASAFLVVGIWLLNYREFDNFKILEHNSNSFAEWEYKEYFSKFIYLIENRKIKENDELLRGFYNFHLTRCSTPECPIKYSHQLDKAERFKNQHHNETYDDFQGKIEFIQRYVCNQMEIASIKFPSLRQLYIFYISPSIEALRYCHKQNFTEYREWTRIEKCLQDKHIEFTTEKSKAIRDEIKEKMESYLDLSNSLWRLLYDDNVDLRRLERLGSQILELQDEVREYDKNPFLDNKSTRLMNDFKKVILDERVSQSRPTEESNKQAVFEEIHTREAPILVISAEPETIQKIESANAACCQLLGYSKTELLEKNLNALLPDFILSAHVKLLTQRSREILYAKEKNLKTLVYAVSSSGYLTESKLGIMQLNSITGRKWSCTFEPTHTRNCVLVLDQSNVVQGINSCGLLMRMNLNTIGKEVHKGLMEELEKNMGTSVVVGNRIDNLIDEQQTEYPISPNSTIHIRLKDSLMLEDVRIKVVELQVMINADVIVEDKEVVEYDKQFFSFNFPSLVSNIDYRLPIEIRVPEEQHYQFVNFGEGINEMRYLNGQVQFKEDKSESSFEKENTENSIAEIIDFNMKKETYLEALELSKKNLPSPIFELNLLVVLAVVLLTGIAVTNFVLFSIGTIDHITNVYVLSQMHQWFYNFYEIVAESLEIGLINSGLWSNTLVKTFANMTRQLTTIGDLSKSLTQNQTLLNQFIVGQRFDNTNVSLYDIIAEFKLHTNTILNNQTAAYKFASDSPITLITNITVNYVVPGFQSISDQLTASYTSSVQSGMKLYIIFLLCFVGICLPLLIRIFFINRKLNREKERLLSIFLEVEQSTVKKLIDRNNSFKMMVKYDRDLTGDDADNLDCMEEESEEEEKSARKRIKDIQPVHYFYPFLVFFLVLCGIYSINIYLELSYISTLNTDLNQLVVYDKSHFSSMELWLYTNYLVLFSGSVVQGQNNSNGFLVGCVSNIYNRQMSLRELYLGNLNTQMLSTTFSDFFVDFWVSNGCSYLTYQGCTTEYNSIFKQGADQVWSLVVRKLDLMVSTVLAANTSTGFPANYAKTFAAYQPVATMRNILTYYYEDVLTVYNQNLIQEALCTDVH